MVDIINVAHTVAQVQEVADRCIDIVQNDVLRHQFICALADCGAKFLFFRAGVQDFPEYGIPYLFADAQFFAVKRNIAGDIYHAVTDYLDFLFDEPDFIFAGLSDEVFLGFCLNEGFLYAGLLNFQSLVIGQDNACIKEQFAGSFVNHRAGQFPAGKTAGNAQLFIILIAAEPAQVIPLCIKEEVVQVCQGAFYRRRFARTQLLVYIDQRIFCILGGILLENRLVQTFVIAEHLFDFFIAADSQRTDKCCNRNLPVFINPHIDNIVGIHFIFQPCAAVRDYSCFKQILTGAVFFRRIINARRTNQLRYDNTFCAIDDKRAAFRHQRKVSHEDFAFLYFTGFLVPKSCRHPEGGCIGNIAFLALCNGIFRGVINPVVCEIQYQIAVIIRYGRNVTENFFQSFFPEPVV